MVRPIYPMIVAGAVYNAMASPTKIGDKLELVLLDSGCEATLSFAPCMPKVCLCRDNLYYQFNKDMELWGGCSPPWGVIGEKLSDIQC